METLEDEEHDDRLANKKEQSLIIPTEIIEDIFSRLPVKSILRFRTLSKPWLSIISDPSFTKLHSTRATSDNRTALFISAYDDSTGKQHLLSAAHDGGSLTHLMTLDDVSLDFTTQSEHLNGLVLFTLVRWCLGYTESLVLVVNPSTHKIFKLHDPYAYGKHHTFYLFGFDESTNEHKILTIRKLIEPNRLEVMIFCMSNYSWRKIDAELPIGFSLDSLCYNHDSSVCVNSVVHLMLAQSFAILAFDLRTEKFSIIKTPKGVLPDGGLVVSDPYIIKINDCIGVVCDERVL